VLVHDEFTATTPDTTGVCAGYCREVVVNVNLAAGDHAMRVDYVDFTGNAIIQVQWIFIGDSEPGAVEVTDGRLCFSPGQARAAVYMEDGSLVVYGINADDKGEKVISLTLEELSELRPDAEENMLIASSHLYDIEFYQLRSGEYQLNVGPTLEGKTYVCKFAGVPPIGAKVTTFSLYGER
jgi:hypothetical protein